MSSDFVKCAACGRSLMKEYFVVDGKLRYHFNNDDWVFHTGDGLCYNKVIEDPFITWVKKVKNEVLP